MPENKTDAIADGDEVLRYYTAVLRGEIREAKVSEQMKAGELLARRTGALEQQPKPQRKRRSDTLREIDAALRRIREQEWTARP